MRGCKTSPFLFPHNFFEATDASFNLSVSCPFSVDCFLQVVPRSAPLLPLNLMRTPGALFPILEFVSPSSIFSDLRARVAWFLSQPRIFSDPPFFAVLPPVFFSLLVRSREPGLVRCFFPFCSLSSSLSIGTRSLSYSYFPLEQDLEISLAATFFTPPQKLATEHNYLFPSPLRL